MATNYDYPGVYIEEQPAEGAIQPVGTSTAAFIGPAAQGPINQPTFVTSWNRFKDVFGKKPMDGFHLWYAVRGFFENGGRRAYIVRASSGSYASLTLNDSRVPAQGPQPTLIVEARKMGAPSPPITIAVTHTSLVNVQVFRSDAGAQGTANTDRIQVASAAEAAEFRPEDQVYIEGGGSSETITVKAVRNDLLILSSALTNSYPAASSSVRLADLVINAQTLRLPEAAGGLGPGSVLEISQQQGTPAVTVTATAVVESIRAERISATLTTYRATLEDAIGQSFDLSPSAQPVQVQSQEFTLTLTVGTGAPDYRPFLSMARRNPRYFATYLAKKPFSQVTVREPDVPSNAQLPDRRPAVMASASLQNGASDMPASLTLAHYQKSLDSLQDVDDVNFIAIPDRTDLSVQLALLDHCEEMGDRVAIFDSPQGMKSSGVRNYVGSVRSDLGFAALYYPWIKVNHPDGGVVQVPPSGHVAGIYAKADIQRGVHKAPANYTLNGALGVTVDMDNETQGPLNLDGVNVLRVFPRQRRPVVWGARTTSDKTAWQYINVRRLLLFIEESIEEGIRWAVFEPNNQQLWAKLRRVITAFLTPVWRSGALFGETADQAFYVKIDEDLNTFAEQQLGRLYIEIGIRPTYPAEFIIVRIGIWSGGAEVTES